jgi:hypothetical protein
MRFAKIAAAVAIMLGGSTLLAAVTQGSAFAAGTYRTTATVNVRSGPGTGYSQIGVEPKGASLTLLCQWQGGTNVGGNSTWDRVTFANGLTGAITDFWTTTPSWNNYAPGTGSCTSGPSTPQMLNAAAWARAHLGQLYQPGTHTPWSGFCERFAYQAEGSRKAYTSAYQDYLWQRNAGRVHTDSNPPVGAEVYYGGGANGHVAISIGNGQEIGTYGLTGNVYPVKSYPVRGYLSNPYYGWAAPFGS